MRSIFLFSAICLVMTSLYAKECKNPCEELKKPFPTEIYCGGFTMGYSFNNMLGTSESVLMLGYINDRFLADIGFNYEHIRGRMFHFNMDVSTFVGHLGLRDRLYQNLFVTYGAVGAVSFGETIANVRPFSVGAFAGLDYQIMRHFLLSIKAYPFVFEKTYSGMEFYEVFETGVISGSYVF